MLKICASFKIGFTRILLRRRASKKYHIYTFEKIAFIQFTTSQTIFYDVECVQKDPFHIQNVNDLQQQIGCAF